VISPPFPPGYPTRYTTAPRWIAHPGGAGEDPASRQNHWTAGMRPGKRVRCYTSPRCSVWGPTPVSVFTDRILVRHRERTAVATRVPFDPSYTALVGTAVYVFAYYEWAMIYLIQQFKPGFVSRYCRGAPMTSGEVKRELEAVLNDASIIYTKVSLAELNGCCSRFASLIDKRNALIHAHPITDTDGSQILNYQAKVDRPLPDMKWPVTSVEQVLQEFDAAACEINALLHRLL
jgi:hypothetical protein